MQPPIIAVAFLLVFSSLAGCLNPDDNRTAPPGETPFDFGREIPTSTFYHFAGAENATEDWMQNGSSVLTGNNVPHFAQGTYYGIGMTTFEPTVGVTQAGNVYMTSWGNGANGATAIVQCINMVSMTNSSDYSCTDVGPPWVPNSNDPYLYVDLWTDRLVKFDMHAVSGMTVETSDNEGNSWFGPTAVTWPYALQDHQTIASSPFPCQQPLNCYDTTYVFCVNAGHNAPLCSTSFDGGITWTPEISGAPDGCNSGGLTGHIVGSPNGNFYRGNPGCDGSGYSAYRSTDGGFEWTEHPLPTAETGTADTWNFEELAVATDDEDNVHALWMGSGNHPWYAWSGDEGETWSEPLMVAPPGLNGTGFPTIAAGSAGRVALGYIGTTNGGATWNGYLGVMTDSFVPQPLITTIMVNAPDDPLDNEKVDCGYDRCGGFGDFIDIVVAPDGRPWFGLAHNPAGEIGIFGTFAEGPSLRGDTAAALAPLPLGGPGTL
ncbi:MAG: hypothetical protein BEU05_01875 [Marine Group III euryarchaeote CG-Bathy2]|uniref:Exo-alpha-sialidase n=2 Tax=Methanobacteriati TaxID=3366610 RepID=A0A075HWG8_9EURY|nr:hypothetical protein [uncultured marine group II/III euryarchaeote KM3_91_D09]OIR10275.1 MAG: hypothetical protein BEU05_01875 [Marine Group III euryarchaeote CG-Bathy2]